MAKKFQLGVILKSFFSAIYMRFLELFGIFLFFSALGSIVALISYCSEDPSFNTAIDGTCANLLSNAGSYYADLMLQFFGSSSYLFSLILFSFGYQMMKYHVISFFRILAGGISCITASTFFAMIHIKMLSAGIVGNYIWDFLKSLHELRNTQNLWIADSILCVLCVVSAIFAMRLHRTSFRGVFSIPYLSEEIKELDENQIDNQNTQTQTPSPVIKIIQPKKAADQRTTARSTYKHRVDGFVLPSINLLKEAQGGGEKFSESELKEKSANLLNVLNDFGINGEISGVSPGPVVTLYELKPAAGIKSSRVIGLSSDIARYMSAVSARVAVIPGKNALGIELPNQKRETVYLREILESSIYQKSAAALPISLGKDIAGGAIVADLSKMPHLLIAGTTGSGKSVGINAMILSLLYKMTPSECKFIMIDPKMLELSVYDDIPHLLTPVVTDPKKAVVALKWAVREMESRYKAMSKLGVRNIEGYNSKLETLKSSGEAATRRVHTGFDPETGAPTYENQTIETEPLPYIVIIVDEMADLMLVAGKDIEIAVQRLAQMARAAGIHLIMATQRPSVDVITGTIKANFPTRISFHVSSKIDSRTILGEQGAEQLLGQGDMLYMSSGGKMTRIHCPFVSDGEVEKITQHLKEQGEPHYVTEILEDEDEMTADGFSDGGGEGEDPMYKEALNLILSEGKASTSFIQRHLKIGYNRAARIIDQMEKAGIVSAANHVGKREIIGR